MLARLKTPLAKAALAVFVLALVARTLFFTASYQAHNYNLVETIHGGDAYFEISANILAGHGFSADSEPPYNPHPLRTPGYPYVLATLLWLFNSYWLILILQLCVGSLSCVLGLLVAHKLTQSLNIGTFVGAFLVFEPYHILFSGLFFTETIFIFLFLSFILLFLHYLERPTLRLLSLSAFVLGVATLTKTTPQFIPFLLIPLIFWRMRDNLKQALLHASVFGVIFLALLAPWMYRNYQKFGVVGMSAQPAFNLIVYLAPSVIALQDGTPLDQASYLAERHLYAPDITLANASLYTPEAIHIIRTHIRGLVLVVLISGVTFFTHDGILTVLQHVGVTMPSLPQPALVLLTHDPLSFMRLVGERILGPEGFILLFRLINTVVTALFVWGVLVLHKKKMLSVSWVFVLLLIAYFLITTPVNGLGVNARFRMPVEILITTTALVPVAIWLKKRHTFARR